jgi:hypothetical protein
MEPARQTASTPESNALPVFPVLATRPPDLALEGVRIGSFLPPVTNPFPEFVNYRSSWTTWVTLVA